MSKKQPTTQQLEIIKETEGNIRVRAVPGSGKTYVLTSRIAYLITELCVEPSSIVAMTFTNKAANEMKYRLKKMIGDLATCFAGTFHGYCNLILKEEIYRLSYPKSFVILDKKAQIDLLREVAEELGFALKDFNAKECVEKICVLKKNMDYVELITGSDKTKLESRINSATEDFDSLYYNYLKKQADNYALDFEDIIQFAIYILTHHRDALEKWQSRCQYVLCDEYQDVNENQELLLSLLSGKYHNLTVVGDDDQCIYGWRGSDVEYMIEFDAIYADVKDFALSENFRSTPEIVAVANSLIKANQNRLEKVMFTNNPSGAKPVYNLAKTEKEEALWIADKILAGVKNKMLAGAESGSRVKYGDYAILVRTASQTRALEEVFIQKKLPYRILSGARFYSSEEIKTVISYLRLIYSLNDIDFMWTIKRPRKGFGKKSIDELKNYANAKGISLMEALGELIKLGMIKKTAVIDFYNNVMELHGKYQEYSSKALANIVLNWGYRAELELDINQTRLDNVSELLSTIAALEEENQDNIQLDELLAHFALFTAQDDDTDKNAVRVMTIHAAKGLEFPVVFVNGLVDGQFPSKRLINEDEYEEERRLFYVAVTRAKKELYLSGYECKVENFPSRPSAYLDDIDYNLLEYTGKAKQKPKNADETPNEMLPKVGLKVGDKVRHPVFGVGEIVEVLASVQAYEIDFEEINGTRRIMFRAKLEKM